MSAAMPLPDPGPPVGPRPVIWTVTEFHNMKEHGIFRGQWVFLVNGRLFEQHHQHPTDPNPRPLRFTREQYNRLGELGFFRNRRVQLLRGEIIEMSPQGWQHFTAISVTARVLETAFGLGFFVRQQGPLALGGEQPEPDVAVVPGSPRDYTAHPTTALLIVEVSDTTLDLDVTTKAELYATAGIADYWVLDLDNRQLRVFRDPGPLSPGLGATAYRTLSVFGPADSVSPLAAPASAVRVADLLP